MLEVVVDIQEAYRILKEEELEGGVVEEVLDLLSSPEDRVAEEVLV